MSERSLEQASFEMGTIMLNEPYPLERKLQEVIPILAGYLKAANCSIMLINHDQMTVEVKAATNSNIIGMSRNLSDVTISTRAIIDDKPFHVGSGKRSFFDALDSSKYKTDYSLSVPVKHLDRKLGVMNFTDFDTSEDIAEETEKRAMALIKHFAAYLYAVMSREQLETKVKRLEGANQELRSLNEMRNSLTAFIMRELKGPISTIVANLDMIGFDPLTPEQAECLNLATEDVYRMQNMVMDMLDVMNMEEGSVAIYRADADLSYVIGREAAAFANLMERRNIELKIDAASHISYIDESLIGRVVVNILRNAISHTPDGGSILILAEYKDEPKETVVSVSDQGKGVPPDMRDKIFERYCSGDTDSKSIRGSGLGLNFCKLVIEAHGGSVWVEDSESGGAKFVFTIPEALTGKGVK